MKQCPNGTTGCSGSPLAWRHTIYDGLGRMTREELLRRDELLLEQQIHHAVELRAELRDALCLFAENCKTLGDNATS